MLDDGEPLGTLGSADVPPAWGRCRGARDYMAEDQEDRARLAAALKRATPRAARALVELDALRRDGHAE